MRSVLDEEELERLADSINQTGLLQPILVKISGDRFLLIAGFRRLMAHRMLSRDKVLARIKPEDYKEETAATLIENIQREDLPVMDESRACRSLVDTHGWGIPATARKLGKSEAWVRGRLDLLRLPPSLAEALQNKAIGINVALELSRITNEDVREAFTTYAVRGGCTSDQARRWREQAERDEEAGLTTPGLNPEESVIPPSHLYETKCELCENPFDSIKVRVIRTCPHCHEAMFRLRGEENEPRRDQEATERSNKL